MSGEQFFWSSKIQAELFILFQISIYKGSIITLGNVLLTFGVEVALWLEPALIVTL